MQSVSERYGHWFQPAWSSLQERAPQRYRSFIEALGRGGVDSLVAPRPPAAAKRRPPFHITGPGWHDVKKDGLRGPDLPGEDIIQSFYQMNFAFVESLAPEALDELVVSRMMISGGHFSAVDLYAPRAELRTEIVPLSGTQEEQAAYVDRLAKGFLSGMPEAADHAAFFGVFSSSPLLQHIDDPLEGSVTQRRLVSDGRLIGWMMSELCADAPSVVVEHWLYQCAQQPRQVRLEEVPPEEIVTSRSGFYALAGQARTRWFTRIGVHGIAAPPAPPARR